MTAYTLAITLLFFVAATCLFGFVKGGAAERVAAAIILANLLIGMANTAYFHQQILSLVNNGLTAILLLPLAVRYASLWLGGVMILYSLQFGLHAVYYVLERPRDTLYANLNNLDFFAVCLCLLFGTILAWRRRRSRAGELAPQPAP